MNKPTIMVVDDESFICDSIKSMLANKFDVCTFLSGEIALKHLEKNHVDLILLDYMMPDMTGYEILLKIQQSEPQIAKIPVIFITGNTNERLEREMLNRGATDYICKTYLKSDLTRCIDKHIKTG